MIQDKFYLVTFYGIPNWEDWNTSQPCTRRYLFSSQGKAAEFVRRRTNTPDWLTHPAFPKGSMMSRIKKGSSNRYNIVTLTVDEICDEASSTGEVKK